MRRRSVSSVLSSSSSDAAATVIYDLASNASHSPLDVSSNPSSPSSVVVSLPPAVSFGLPQSSPSHSEHATILDPVSSAYGGGGVISSTALSPSLLVDSALLTTSSVASPVNSGVGGSVFVVGGAGGGESSFVTSSVGGPTHTLPVGGYASDVELMSYIIEVADRAQR